MAVRSRARNRDGQYKRRQGPMSMMTCLLHASAVEVPGTGRSIAPGIWAAPPVVPTRVVQVPYAPVVVLLGNVKEMHFAPIVARLSSMPSLGRSCRVNFQ